MIIGSRAKLKQLNNGPQVKLGNNKIKRVGKCKTPGIVVDDQLLWNNNTDSIYVQKYLKDSDYCEE